ncbi:MAG: hypothetical protein Q9184_004853 [Pyrenodesmia sp. 2 TL-2023]
MFFPVFLLAFLLTFLLSSVSEARPQLGTPQADQATCSLAQFDRCGPANQAPGTPNTCNATITNPGRDVVYGSRCFRDETLQSRLIKENCVNAAIPDICNKLTDPRVVRNQWIWTNPAVIGCALGFWLPAGNGTDATFAPEYNRCLVGIYRPLVESCTNPTWNNAGSVNIRIMPNSTQSGLAVDPFYPSYVIAPSQLTTSPGYTFQAGRPDSRIQLDPGKHRRGN